MEVKPVELATKYVPLGMFAKMRGVSYQWMRANMIAGLIPVGRQIGKLWIIEAKDIYEQYVIVVTNAMIDEYKRRKA